MDRKYIDDRHVVARYLADQLGDDEREQFEAYFIEHPEMVRELEATAHFKVGLMQLRDSGELERLLKPVPWYRQPKHLAAVATLAAVLIGAGYLLQNRPGSQPLLVAQTTALHGWLGQPLATASSHTLLRTRSSAFDADIELPGTAHAIELHVLPEFAAQPARYRISLLRLDDDGSAQRVAEADDLLAADNGFVTVYLNSARIQPGRYQLLISGDETTTAADRRSTFQINVREPAPAN